MVHSPKLKCWDVMCICSLILSDQLNAVIKPLQSHKF